jgi:hypothetical protein
MLHQALTALVVSQLRPPGISQLVLSYIPPPSSGDATQTPKDGAQK